MNAVYGPILLIIEFGHAEDSSKGEEEKHGVEQDESRYAYPCNVCLWN